MFGASDTIGFANIMSLFVIRVDSSQQIGSGHVMRCLMLAETLRDSGVDIEFVTRDHPGNLNEHIIGKGFKTHLLPNQEMSESQQNLSGYEQWLCVPQALDAAQTIEVVEGKDPYWMIIDHYALDCEWEEKLRPHTRRIMVIDDLANRKHDCDLLLDQNYIHDQHRYDELLLPEALRLLGPKYALLRKDFATNNTSSIQNQHGINRVLIFFGGYDPDNLTSTAIKALKHPDLQHLWVDVIVGSANPHIVEVREQVDDHPNAQLHIQIENIAELMAKADIALGAGGSTTWERMAIGLPSIVVTIEENQIAYTRDLEQDGYIQWLGNGDQVDEHDISGAILRTIENPHQLQEQSRKGRRLVDGMGAQIVSRIMISGPDVSAVNVLDPREALDKINCTDTVSSQEKNKKFSITVLSDRATWINPWIKELLVDWAIEGHCISWVHSPYEVPDGDFCFILSCSEVVKADVLNRNNHSLVVHESDLPKGRGWSPISWQVLEGENTIPVTLFEATDKVDSGVVYMKREITLNGDELVDELRKKQASVTIDLCKEFVARYPDIMGSSQSQTITPSYYPKRTPADSMLDPNKTLAEQFNLLRIVDNKSYPAYFDWLDQRYYLKIGKEK